MKKKKTRHLTTPKRGSRASSCSGSLENALVDAISTAVEQFRRRQRGNGQGLGTKQLECSPELLAAVSGGLRSLNTQELKELCKQNGIPRSGAKYEIVANIESHVEGWRRQEKLNKLDRVAANGDLMAATSLILSKTADFDKCTSKAQEIWAQDIPKQQELQGKIDMLLGITQGLNEAIHVVVTGPKASHYNGKYGEGAVDANRWLAGVWLSFMQGNSEEMTAKELEKCLEKLSIKGGAEAYGFDSVLDQVFEQTMRRKR